jgi:hypothetical protein
MRDWPDPVRKPEIRFALTLRFARRDSCSIKKRRGNIPRRR